VRDLRSEYLGEESNNSTDEDGTPEVVNLRDKIKPDVYILAEPLTKDNRESDPRINSKNLIEIKRVPSKFWYDPKTDRIILELK